MNDTVCLHTRTEKSDSLIVSAWALKSLKESRRPTTVAASLNLSIRGTASLIPVADALLGAGSATKKPSLQKALVAVDAKLRSPAIQNTGTAKH